MTVLLRPAPVALAFLSAASLSVGPATAQSRKTTDHYRATQPACNCGPSAMPAYQPAYVAPAPMPVADNRRPLDYSPRSGVAYKDGDGYRVTRNDLGKPRAFEAAMPTIWTGLYLGAHGGYGWGKTNANHADLGNVDTSGGLGGLHLGYNWQSGQAVFGVEGDLSASGVDGKRTFALAGVDADLHTTWTSSVRGRLGYSFSNVMLYGTAGFAFAGHDLTVSDPGASLRVSDTHLGYVVGAGLEMKLAPMMSVRGEVLHYGFGEKTYDFGGEKVPLRLYNTTVRAGVSFHLN